MNKQNTIYTHLALAPVAALGLLGYFTTLLMIASFALPNMEVLQDVFVKGVEVGVIVLNLLNEGIEVTDGLAFFGVFFGIALAPLMGLIWLTFLVVGWFYQYPFGKKVAIKTAVGWLLWLVYYPLIAYGLISIFILLL